MVDGSGLAGGDGGSLAWPTSFLSTGPIVLLGVVAFVGADVGTTTTPGGADGAGVASSVLTGLDDGDVSVQIAITAFHKTRLPNMAAVCTAVRSGDENLNCGKPLDCSRGLRQWPLETVHPTRWIALHTRQNDRRFDPIRQHDQSITTSSQGHTATSRRTDDGTGLTVAGSSHRHNPMYFVVLSCGDPSC